MALICAGAVASAQPAFADVQLRLESYLDVFTQTTHKLAKEDQVSWWNRASLDANFNLTGRLSFQFGGYASYASSGTLDGGPSAPGEHTVTARYADITAFNLRLGFDDFDLVAGKAHVGLGVGSIYSPLQVLEPVNINDPLHEFAMGLWQVGADIYRGRDTFSFRVIPFDERSRLPSERSRWLGDSGDITLIGIGNAPSSASSVTNVTFVDSYRDASVSNWGYLASYKRTGEGFDVAAGAYYGAGLYPVVRVVLPTSTSAVVFKERPDTLIGFGTLTWATLHWKAYGELLIQHATNDDDDDFGQALVGVTYDAWNLADALKVDTVMVTMEYTGDHVLNTMNGGPLRFSSVYTRPYRNSLLGELDLGVTSKFLIYGKAEVNASEWDSGLWFGTRYRYTDDIAIHLEVNLFNGEPNTPFGRWRYNDGMFFGFEYTL